VASGNAFDQTCVKVSIIFSADITTSSCIHEAIESCEASSLNDFVVIHEASFVDFNAAHICAIAL